MLNQVVLVGRISKEVETNGKVATMTIGVPRNLKNANGEYDIDYIEIKMFDTIANNVKEYCKKGDIVGVKGRLQVNLYPTDNESIISYKTEVMAEKVTFLSSKSKESE